MNRSLADLLRKVKDSGSSQSVIESDPEKKGRVDCVDDVECLVEGSKKSLFLEERLFVSSEVSNHVLLVKGVVCDCSPITVLCPILAKGIACTRGTGPAMRGKPFRPKLLLKNYADPSLQLWYCEGCKDVLLKVDMHACACLI